MYLRRVVVSHFNKFDKEFCSKYDQKCTGCPLRIDKGKCYYTELKGNILKEV